MVTPFRLSSEAVPPHTKSNPEIQTPREQVASDWIGERASQYSNDVLSGLAVSSGTANLDHRSADRCERRGTHLGTRQAGPNNLFRQVSRKHSVERSLGPADRSAPHPVSRYSALRAAREPCEEAGQGPML